MRSLAQPFRAVATPPHPESKQVTASLNKTVFVVTTWAAKAERNPVFPGRCYRRGPWLRPKTSPRMCATRNPGILTRKCPAIPATTTPPSALSSPTSRYSLRILQKGNDDSSCRQTGSGLRRSDFLFARGSEQHNRLRLELPVCAPCSDDGLDISRQPRHVARSELACVAHAFLSCDYHLGNGVHDPLLVGRIHDGAGTAQRPSGVSSSQAYRNRGADVLLTDVVRCFSQCRRGVVSDVAVDSVELAG